MQNKYVLILLVIITILVSNSYSDPIDNYQQQKHHKEFDDFSQNNEDESESMDDIDIPFKYIFEPPLEKEHFQQFLEYINLLTQDEDYKQYQKTIQKGINKCKQTIFDKEHGESYLYSTKCTIWDKTNEVQLAIIETRDFEEVSVLQKKYIDIKRDLKHNAVFEIEKKGFTDIMSVLKYLKDQIVKFFNAFKGDNSWQRPRQQERGRRTGKRRRARAIRRIFRRLG